jgi:hypothetical protein
MSSTSLPERVDLSENSDFLLSLIDRPLQWRERLVEELAFEAGAHVRVASAYQVDIPPNLIREFADTETHQRANVLLPLTTRAKELLLHLDVTGLNGAPAHVLSRASIAALETEYLVRLIETSPACDQVRAGLPENLLEAICVFTPGYYESLLDDEGSLEQSLLRYLTEGLPASVQLDEACVRRWRASTARATDLLAWYGDWLPPGISSAEEVLLAIPDMEPCPGSTEQIDVLLTQYDEAVMAAAAAGDDVLLTALTEYGRRFEFIVEVEIPLLEPSTIKLNEDRALGRSTGGWVMQEFRLSDARSAHLEARILDPNVEIDNFEVHDLHDNVVALGPLESVRRTDEALALYSSEPDRPDYARLRLRLRPRRHLRWTSIALMVLNLLAAVAAIAMPRDGISMERLSLLALPTTLATTFVLVREETALASWLQRHMRVGLGLTTAALWAVVLSFVVMFHPPKGEDSSRAARPTGAVPGTARDTGTRLGPRKEINGAQRSTRRRTSRRDQGSDSGP